MKEDTRSMDEYLVQKYGHRADMYIEYPHKRNWSREFGEADLKDGLSTLFPTLETPALLYVHMPYCQKQCWFCTCHVEISNDYENVKKYLQYLYKEIDLYRKFFQSCGKVPNFKEIHLGGGSPTFMKEPEFEELVARLGTIANIRHLDEFAIEIDPRRVKQPMLEFYHRQGINRISIGVQDFDLRVQKAVNRVQPAVLTERLLTPETRALFPNGINFDIICGLPHQTPDSMRKTMETVVRLSPDRVCLNYLDYSESTIRYYPHQLLMPHETIPGGYSRKVLFLEALKVLEEGGYVRTGYDHFAKPTDGVACAMREEKMIWNSLGVTPGRCVDIVGIGVHSYSRLGEYYYAQSVYELPQYLAALEAGKFPVFRGYVLSEDDRIRRSVIHALRSYFFLRFSDIEGRYGIDFGEYFSCELESLTEFIQDGIVELNERGVVITELGHQFANLVCKKFDRYQMPISGT